MAVGELLVSLAAHLLLTALPAVAAALCAARLGVRSVPVLLAIALAATGVLAMLAFWAYYADPVIGESLSYLALFGAVALVVWALYGGHLDRGLLGALATPLALWALGSTFLLFFGFLHGGTGEPLAAGATRFSHPLPGDSYIPQFYAEWFYAHGHAGDPPRVFGIWLSSDRPPLQVGYALSQFPFGWGGRELHYQVLGVVLQQLWIVALWALLLAARVGRVTRALAMAVVLVSPVAIVNGFYVWPKLLPAALLIAAAALAMTPLWDELRRSLWAAALIGALLALALLGHGSGVFGAIPLALVAAYRGIPSWRWLGVAAIALVVLFAPWSAYQKYGDPPGDRVTKWMLAGVPEGDDRGLTETILDSYGEAGLGGTIHNKAENFVTMAGGGPMASRIRSAFDSGDLEVVVREARAIQFFNLFPAFGLLLLAPLAMLAARRRRGLHPAEWSFALACFAFVAVGAVAWGLILFGNEAGRAVLHVGSYALPILGIVGAIAGLRASFPRFALFYGGFAALLSLAIYAPVLDPLEGTSYSAAAIVLSVLALAGFAALALHDAAAPVAAGD
jgi:hypothetical protein